MFDKTFKSALTSSSRLFLKRINRQQVLPQNTTPGQNENRNTKTAVTVSPTLRLVLTDTCLSLYLYIALDRMARQAR